MRTLFPTFLDLSGRPVLLVGGGVVAAQKLRPLLDARASVTVVAPDVAASIQETGVTVHRRRFEPRDLDGCWYVVAGAPPEINAEIQRECEARRIFVNAVDDPGHATAFAGSLVRRGPVTVAISTGGQAPALAGLMREALERLLPEPLAEWTAIATALRAEWRRDGVPMAERRSDLLDVLVELRAEPRCRSGGPSETESPSSASSVGNRALSAPSARSAADRTLSVPSAAGTGSVAIVGSGPGDPGLLTRRAAECLARADLVLYDSLVSEDVLALAPRARLVHVGRRVGRATATQDHVHELLASAVGRGEHAVRLKGGDPFVFGRGGEDVLALAERGIVCEVVPGVSSATAGPALAGIPVTHRGVSSGLMVVTGHDIDRFRTLTGQLPTRDLTLVVLMAMGQRRAIAEHMLDSGWRSTTPAAVVRGASWRESAVWIGTLADLASDEDRDIQSDVPGLLVIGDVVNVREEARAALARSAAAEVEVCHG